MKNDWMSVDINKLKQEIDKYKKENRTSRAKISRSINISESTLAKAMTRGTLSRSVIRKLLELGMDIVVYN